MTSLSLTKSELVILQDLVSNEKTKLYNQIETKELKIITNLNLRLKDELYKYPYKSQQLDILNKNKL